MFGNKSPFKEDKKKTKRAGASTHNSAVTIISHGCQFNGKLYCRGASRIGGRIEGEIVSDGLLIIEEEAFVAAKIKAEEVIVQGHIRGTLEVMGRVELDQTCLFEGEIITPRLIIKEGAIFNGKSSMPNPKEDNKKNIEPLLKHSKKEELLVACNAE